MCPKFTYDQVINIALKSQVKVEESGEYSRVHTNKKDSNVWFVRKLRQEIAYNVARPLVARLFFS